MKQYKVKKGYDIPITGKPEANLIDAPNPDSFAINPEEFHGVKPRLHIKEGDSVKIGSPLFEDKNYPAVQFCSPAAGKISEIQFGPRRVVKRISISGGGHDVVQHETFRVADISGAAPDKLRELLLKGGIWPLIRQRPFDVIARPDSKPKSIFINCMDTAPLAGDAGFALQGQFAEFEAGIEALKVLGHNVPIHVVLNPKGKQDDFLKANGVQFHAFTGKHPAGLVSTHIEKIDRIQGATDTVWYLTAYQTAQLGSFLLQGQYPQERVVTVTGSGAQKRQYYRIRNGAVLKSILRDNLAAGEQRIIAGNVLTGRHVGPDDAPSFYSNQITVIPEGRERHFMAWLSPGFSRWTYSRAYVSGWMPGKKFSMHTNMNGEHRALVKTGDYNHVMALDILPDFLAKAILAEDVELMEKLGILECAPEDFALCSYICPSKTEFTEIIKEGLDMMRAELT